MNPSTPDGSGPAQPDAGAATVFGNPLPPAAPRFTVTDIFFGRNGLRALWGILIFLALAEILPRLIFPLFQAMFSPARGVQGLFSLRRLLVFEGAGLVSIALATWGMARIERRRTAVYGFAPQHGMRNFCSGLAWGVALLSLLVVILRATGLLVFDARLLYGPAALRYGALWLGGFLLVAFREEMVSRAYLQFTLTRGLGAIYRRLFGGAHANAAGFWTAALILSYAFGFGHRTNPGESPLGLLSAGLIALVFCLSLWRTGSLWWAIGFHASWDWAQSFVYGVADSGLMIQGHLLASHPLGRPILSGGLTGPEGSVYLLPIVGLSVAAVILTLPRTNLGYTPAGTREAELDLA
jgi:membrane protease YdiL (CAAX protease family)